MGSKQPVMSISTAGMVVTTPCYLESCTFRAAIVTAAVPSGLIVQHYIPVYLYTVQIHAF